MLMWALGHLHVVSNGRVDRLGHQGSGFRKVEPETVLAVMLFNRNFLNHEIEKDLCTYIIDGSSIFL